MSHVLKQNKFVATAFVLTVVLAGMTFGNLPPSPIPTGVQTIDGTTFNFADYPVLTHEQIAIFNYFNRLVMDQPINSWDGWNAENFLWTLHYIHAFVSYIYAAMCETISGYRTPHQLDFAYTLIEKMNTTIAEYGNQSVEYYEWESNTGFTDYHYPNATNPDDVYTGGFRGPANIMWTGHYALMMALYERNFHTGAVSNELSWFVNSWKNSTTTDGFGNPKDGGIWGAGLIPCEPYVVFAQCNSIPMYTTTLYDNMYGTDFMGTGMWNHGLAFIEENMTDEYGLYIDGYFVQKPVGPGPNAQYAPDVIPGQSQDLLKDGPKLNSYGLAWALMFLESIIPDVVIPKYPMFLNHYGVDVSGDKMYILGSYHYPDIFGDVFGALGTLFTMVLANQRGDYATRDRLTNLMQNLFNKKWSSDGREMYYDASSLEPFLTPNLSGFSVWSTLPVTVRDLADARSAEFWNYPYISAADDDNIWVYQAQWDPAKSGFILNIKVDSAAELTFSNFHSVPTAFSGGTSIGELTSGSGGDYILTLQPGMYQLVIMEGS